MEWTEVGGSRLSKWMDDALLSAMLLLPPYFTALGHIVPFNHTRITYIYTKPITRAWIRRLSLIMSRMWVPNL